MTRRPVGVRRRRPPARPTVTQPATVDEVIVRAWRAFDAAGETSARELAEAAGLTRGGALAFLVDWSKTGHAALVARSGSAAPYDRRYSRTTVSTARAGSERVA